MSSGLELFVSLKKAYGYDPGFTGLSWRGQPHVAVFP